MQARMISASSSINNCFRCIIAIQIMTCLNARTIGYLPKAMRIKYGDESLGNLTRDDFYEDSDKSGDYDSEGAKLEFGDDTDAPYPDINIDTEDYLDYMYRSSEELKKTTNQPSPNENPRFRKANVAKKPDQSEEYLTHVESDEEIPLDMTSTSPSDAAPEDNYTTGSMYQQPWIVQNDFLDDCNSFEEGIKRLHPNSRSSFQDYQMCFGGKWVNKECPRGSLFWTVISCCVNTNKFPCLLNCLQ